MTTAAAGQAPGAEQPTGLMTEYQRTYAGRADQVRLVRRDLAKHLGDCPVTDDATLIASEFGTNAILHSRSRGGCFTIRVQLDRDCLRMECQDAGGPWRGRHQDDDRPHGLAVVEALTGAAAWGMELTADGGSDRLGHAQMVTIGAGRADDPRQWVQAAYLLLDTIEDGGLDTLGKLPAQAEIAAEMGVHRTTVSHAYRELAEMGIVYRVPGLGPDEHPYGCCQALVYCVSRVHKQMRRGHPVRGVGLSPG